MSYAPSSRPAALWGSTRSRSGTSTCASSQSISATRFAVMRMLRGLGSPWTTHVCRPMSRAHAARHRATPSGGIAPRSILVPISACEEVGRRSPARALRPARVNRCSCAERVGHATPVGLGLGRSALHVRHHHQAVGERAVRPSWGSAPARSARARSRCWRSSVSHARSASLLAPRRPTARWPSTRTLHTSLATPPASGSMRATSSPHRPSASHPTATSSRSPIDRDGVRQRWGTLFVVGSSGRVVIPAAVMLELARRRSLCGVVVAALVETERRVLDRSSGRCRRRRGTPSG